MSKTDTDVGTGLVGAPACGDVMKLQIRVDPNSNTISDVKFKTFGCGSAIASSSYLTELVRGMNLDEAGKIRNTEIARELCLPPVKCESCFHGIGLGSGGMKTDEMQCTARCWLRTRSSRRSQTITPRTPRRSQRTWVVQDRVCQRWRSRRSWTRRRRKLRQFRPREKVWG